MFTPRQAMSSLLTLALLDAKLGAAGGLWEKDQFHTCEIKPEPKKKPKTRNKSFLKKT